MGENNSMTYPIDVKKMNEKLIGALNGYIEAGGGEDCTISLMLNDFDIPFYDEISESGKATKAEIEKIISFLDNYPHLKTHPFDLIKGSHDKISIDFCKLQELLQKKCNEKIKKNKENMQKGEPGEYSLDLTIESFLDEDNKDIGISSSSYGKLKRMYKEGLGVEVTERTYLRLRYSLGQDLKKETTEKSIETKEKEKKQDLLSIIKMGFNESDSDTRRLLFDITRSITFAASINQMKNFEETDSIAYIDMGKGKYKAYAPLSSEWDELYTDKNFDARIGHQICDVIVENNLEDEIKVQICDQIDSQAKRKKLDVQQLKANIKARKLVKIETLDIDLLESNKKGFEKYLKKCNEFAESSKNRVITYDILEDGSYLIHIPFEREECEQWEVEYPLEVEINALPIKEDEDGFESKLRDALWDQLWMYLFDGKDDEAFDEEDEIAEKLGISVNTVKTHKSRGFKSLRSKLQDSVCLFLI